VNPWYQLGGAGLAVSRATLRTFATWNPADKDVSITLSNGNLTYSTLAGAYRSVRATQGKSSGKWYWEVVSTGDAGKALNGAAKSTAPLNNFVGVDTNGFGLYWLDGTKVTNSTNTAYAGGAIANSTVVGVKLDMDAGTLGFIVNGVDKGTAFSGLSGTFYPIGGTGSTTGNVIVTANFGASGFSGSVPSGYNPGVYI
jgi:hypothetical protein